MIVIDVAKPRPSDIAVHVTSKSLRERSSGSSEGWTAKSVSLSPLTWPREIDSPASQQAKIIDVATQVAAAWDV